MIERDWVAGALRFSVSPRKIRALNRELALETNKLKVTYDLSVDDLAAFVFFHQRKSPAARRHTSGCLFPAAAIMLAIPTLALIFNKKPIVEAIADLWMLFLFPFLFLAFTFPILKWQTKRMSQHLLREGRSMGFYGPHSLLLNEDGLHETKDAGETFRKWSAVEKMIITPSHLFIYTSGVEAFVVPRTAFPGDQDSIYFCEYILKCSDLTGHDVPQQIRSGTHILSGNT